MKIAIDEAVDREKYMRAVPFSKRRSRKPETLSDFRLPFLNYKALKNRFLTLVANDPVIVLVNDKAGS